MAYVPLFSQYAGCVFINSDDEACEQVSSGPCRLRTLMQKRRRLSNCCGPALDMKAIFRLWQIV
jgi:hypothetical protein